MINLMQIEPNDVAIIRDFCLLCLRLLKILQKSEPNKTVILEVLK